jgi:uncharacterized protein YdcH (DUF465 family)
METVNAEGSTHHMLRNDQHYQELTERHHILDDRLVTLGQRHHLSASEQLEEVAIKKEKLVLKDQMAQIARVCSEQHRSSA